MAVYYQISSGINYEISGSNVNYSVGGFVSSSTYVDYAVAGSYTAGKKQTFTPDATNAGLNIGVYAGNPSSPEDGDVWINTLTNQILARVNGANVDLGAGAGGGDAWSDAVDSNIIPDADSTRDLGSNANRFANIYVDDITVTSSITAAGSISGSNLSGSNTGDQTITLTGDVTGSGTGSFAATIAADSVTYAKLQDVTATNIILGRITAGAGIVEELTAANIRTIINVEDGATADQSAAEIKTAYESNADTNAFTDAEQTKVGHITVTQAVDLDTIESRVNDLDAAVILRGSWDASAGTFPGGGTAQAGDSYIVSTGGTVDSIVFTANDRIVALTDNASTTTYASNWLKLDYTDAVLSVNGQTGAVTGLLEASNNLNDLASSSTARTNLGLGSLATQSNINNSDWSGDDLAVVNGGTGASDAATARTNLGVAIGSDVQAWSAVLDATTASFTTALNTKLTNIEANADVTDTANVQSSVSGQQIAYSAKTKTLTAAASLVNGDLCYIDSSGEAAKADASAEATAKSALYMCTETIAASATGTFIEMGDYTTTGLTAGSVYYISTTAGAITATAPAATGNIRRVVGTAESTTKLIFNPSADWAEVA